MRGGIAVCVAAATTTLLITGCTGDQGSRNEVPAAPAAASTQLATPPPITSRASGQFAFITPSHNIGCVIDDENGVPPIARCDIHGRTWTPPPRPPRCDLDWAGGTQVGTSGRGEFTCAGDAAFVTSQILAYGRGYRVGRFICMSRPEGVTCTNQSTNHGFFISRDATRLF